MQVRRPQLAQIGLFLLVVALPLVFGPFASSPFGDPKLVVLTFGTLVLWAAGVAIDRTLAIVATAWVAITASAALLGVDPSVGFTARTDGQGSGLIVVTCAGVLAVLGAGLPADLRDQARRWLVATGAVVAAIGLIARLLPEFTSGLPGDLALRGATLGNPVFAVGFLAAAVAAAIGGIGGIGERIRPRTIALLAFLALGTASFGERSSIVLPIVAVVVTSWRGRLGWRHAAVVLAAVAIPLAAWQVAEPGLAPDRGGRGEAVTGLEVQATDRQRITVWSAMTRAGLERPVLGWGPGSSRTGFLAVATPEELERSNRNWADAHDLFLEAFVGSGTLGLAALVALCALLAVRALRAGRRWAWSFGAAAALAAYSLVEPVGIVLTPLMFLVAGIASSAPADAGEADTGVGAREAEVRGTGRWVTAIVGALLALASLASLQMLAASSLERWGRVYGETWALRASTRVQPWRLSATERLALLWALDGRAGDEAAGDRARSEIAGAVERHPWDPDARLWAADVAILLFDQPAARDWLDAHLDRFPGDIAVTTGDPSAPLEGEG